MRLSAKELRKLKPQDLNKKLAELRLELLKLRGSLRMKKAEKNTKKAKILRKAIARILTVQREMGKKI